MRSMPKHHVKSTFKKEAPIMMSKVDSQLSIQKEVNAPHISRSNVSLHNYQSNRALPIKQNHAAHLAKSHLSASYKTQVAQSVSHLPATQAASSTIL